MSAALDAGIGVGIFLATRLAAAPGGDDPSTFVDLAGRLESYGYDSVWVGDSLLARPRPEPLTLLGAIAARTRCITLGTAVLLPALRHPVTLAHAVATLDRLAAGRLVLGVGAGFRYPATEHELAAVGVAMAERVGRVAETIDVCRLLWSAREPVSHQGRHFRFADVAIVPGPSRPGGPPIWLGGNEPPALRRAGRVADGWLPTSATPDAFAAGLRGVREAASETRRDAGALTPAVLLTVNAGRERAAAAAELRAWMEAYYGGLPLEVLETILGCHAGTADEVLAWLSSYVAAGARHLVLRFASHDQEAQIAQANALLPRLKELPC